MKHLIALLFFLTPITAYSLTAAVTLQPYAKILGKIAGERVDIVTLVPQGSDPHSFEPKPGTLKDFSKASLYFTDGSGLDKSWLPRFKGVNPNIKIVSMDSQIQWGKLEHHHDHSHQGHGSHHHESLDPHLWTSPKNVKILAANILSALVVADPEGKAIYEKNHKAYDLELDSLSAEIEKVTKQLTVDQKTFMVFHPSFGYFARDYGFVQLCIEVDGKEPKPRDLQRLIQEAKKKGVRKIFVMPNFSKRAASTIAKAIQGSVQEVDPLAYDFENSWRILLQTIAGDLK